ncbi:MAG: hypothetical protein ACOX2S_07325 [bacterium]
MCRELKYNVLYRWFCDFGWDDDSSRRHYPGGLPQTLGRREVP